MSFKFQFAKDISEYGQVFADNSNDPPDPTGAPTGFARISGATGNSQVGNIVYHTGRDRFFSAMRYNSAAGGPTCICFFDPNFQADTPPNADVKNGTTLGGITVTYLQIDQYNPSSGAQRLFLASTGLGNVDEVDVNSLTLTPDIFNGPNGIFSNAIGDLGASGVNGSWACLDGKQLYFTGLTDGIRVSTGGQANANGHLNNLETVASGANVYPDGLFLSSLNSGQLEGNNSRRQFGWVDIRTRRLVGLLGAGLDGVPSGVPEFFPLEVSSTPLGNSGEALINGLSFRWQPVQYIPDSDATFALPKGELVMIPREEIPAIVTPSPGDEAEIYIRVTDFNPFNVAATGGARTRLHGRKRITSRVIVDVYEPFGLAGQNPVQNPADMAIQYDPLRARWVCIIHDGTTADPYPTGTNYSTVGFFSRLIEPAIVTNPAARDVPRTNDIIQFESFVGGDLGEEAGGVALDWALDRRSTEGEVLTVTGGIGTTSTVANPPIDDVSPSINEGTLAVVADGTPLAETTDYTVVLATGVITWVTDQQGAALVTATYEHRETGATPAHGTLLTPDSTSDPDTGMAATQVFYEDDDDLVGTLDQLESTEA